MTDQSSWRPLTVGTRVGAAQPEGPRLDIRGPGPGDQGYISKTWLAQMAEVDRDYSRGAKWGQMGRHVDMVMSRHDTRALIVHPVGDLRTILAWIVYCDGPRVPLVHFLFTRREHRNKGHARKLLGRVGIEHGTSYVYTCRAQDTTKMLRAFPGGSFMAMYRFLGLPSQYEDPGNLYKSLPPPEDR